MPLLVVAFLVSLSLAAGPAVAAPLKAATPMILTDARILVLPPDVKVYEIGAGGQVVLKTEWTDTAREHVRTALEAELVGRKSIVVRYRAPETPDRQLSHLQIFKVHGLVKEAVLDHAYGGDEARLPSKAGRFDWSVGPGAHVLGEDHGDAGYALFVTFVQGHTSGGRDAMNVASYIIGGSVITGRQTGIASFVDLRTGNIIWFNKNLGDSPDLRTAVDAAKAVHRLLKEFPL